MCYLKVNVRRDYEALADYIIEHTDVSKKCDKQLKFLKDGLRNQLFDMAYIESGLTSKKAIESGLKKSQLTKEHMYPRNQSAIRLIDAALDGRSKKYIVDSIKMMCEVHITTKEENLSLVKLQRDPDYHWEKGYKTAGIELIEYEWPNSRNKYVYKVGNVCYNTVREAAKAHGCTEHAASARFTSKAKNSKYKGWTRYERVD